MAWLLFKHPHRAAEFSAPGTARKRCRKCDGGGTGVRYDKSLDVLRYRCHDCGYEWTGPCADAGPARAVDILKQYEKHKD